MRRWPRLRKVTKWAGVVVCAVIVTAFGMCLNRTVAHCRSDPGATIGLRRREVWLSGGVFSYYYHHDTVGSDEWGGWIAKPMPWGVNWSPQLDWKSGRIHVGVPLWVPFLLVAIPTALLWRRDHVTTKRAGGGRCPKCGYDRAGLAATNPCPECGTTPR
jgi:hypothetical protein